MSELNRRRARGLRRCSLRQGKGRSGAEDAWAGQAAAAEDARADGLHDMCVALLVILTNFLLLRAPDGDERDWL
jgi:hypothetical protein